MLGLPKMRGPGQLPSLPIADGRWVRAPLPPQTNALSKGDIRIKD